MAFGLLGRKLGHSWSPSIHAELGCTPYKLYEAEPEALKEFLCSTSLSGMNVTIPYKKDVIPYCAALSDTAQKLGSVNTLIKTDNGWFGDNTDYYGFRYMVKQAGIEIAGKKCLVLGSGGASLTVTQVLRDMGAASVVVISRSGEENYENLHRHADAKVIVNTTPVGMYPKNGTAPVSLEVFPHCEGVLDLIYNPARTVLLMDAEKRKIPHAGGLTMLVAQAKRAAELFMDTTIDDAVIPAITKKLQQKMENIILIGMPGCGKSTVAAALGETLGMEVVDADAEIVKTVGKPIPENFADDGEAAFRKIETEVLADLGKRNGIILSTGGGCVTREGNYPLLHQNGKIIWLQREISDLPTDGRPLSQKNALSEMYKIRKPLYEAFADVTIENNGPLSTTINSLLEALK